MDDVSEEQTKHPRPPQATAACLIVMAGAVFAVLLMWDRIATLHSLETRTAVQKFLDGPQSDGLGLSVAEVLTTVKVVSMATAALGVAMAVQGFWATKRSRSARLALTIMVGPLVLLGIVGDSLVSSGAATFWCAGTAAATITLWLGPLRLWFDGLDPAAVRRDSAPADVTRAERTDWPPPPPDPRTHDGWAPPPEHSAYGEVPPPPTVPRSDIQAWAPPPVSVYGAPSRGSRPRALLWACLLTWVCTALATLGSVLTLVLVSSDTDGMIDRMYRENPDLADQGLSHDMLVTTLYVMGGIALAAAIAAAVFAVLVFLRRRWAWYALVVSAAVTTLLFLVVAVTQPASLVFVAAAAATVFCLARPEVRAWLLRR
jgi:hypothetical protein